MRIRQDNKDGRRCTKCVLPEALPASNFNTAGECSWCQSNFPNYRPAGEEKLCTLLERVKSKSSSADCLVGISGGKDSSYALLEMKRSFGMRVEAFTYVHDGLTEFALKNATEVCQALQVKHHLVSLPHHRHLRSCRAYFAAWLESEDPVAAAMTCVACKHLHILGTQLAHDRNIPLIIWAESPLETPPFIPTQSESGTDARSRKFGDLAVMLIRNLLSQNKFRSAFFRNIPTSLYGCLAFRPECGYLHLRYPGVTHLQFFDYCRWDSAAIVMTLREYTPWSVPSSVVSDWHSDCLFNVFKEYMFQKMLGASYTDAFLSNQIRHGLLTRDQAWDRLVKSKAYYAEELGKTLSALNMDHLQSKCDVTCFEIEGNGSLR